MRFVKKIANFRFAVLVVALSALLSLSANAWADEQPTTQQLLDQCQRGASCTFHPSGMSVHNGAWHLAGSATNCTNAPAKRGITYQVSEGASNSFGIEITASSKLGQSFEASVTTSYHREWNWSASTSDTYEQDVPAKSRVIISVAKQKTRVSGTYELHFDKRYYGHYIWYVNGWIDGQTKGQPWEFKSDPAKANC